MEDTSARTAGARLLASSKPAAKTAKPPGTVAIRRASVLASSHHRGLLRRPNGRRRGCGGLPLPLAAGCVIVCDAARISSKPAGRQGAASGRRSAAGRWL